MSLIACTAFVCLACGSDDESESSAQETEPALSPATRAPTREPTPAPTPDPTPVPDPILVGAGDATSCTQDNDDVTAELLDAVVASTTGEVVVFTAGDNVYEYGTIDEYQQCYDPTWGRHKERTRPVPGNHEYGTGNAEGYFTYFGAVAGDPAQGYYSYDVGSWHVIVLNTSDHCKSILCSTGSPQETWLRADLAAHPAVCTLVIWHDPLFSSGRTHGSLGHVQPFWETLYRYGADVVVNGHEHNYERFAPQTPDGAADPDYGIREIVAGTGGESHYREGDVLTANSEAADDNTYGVLKLTLRESGYDWEFIPEPRGTFRDSGSGECHGPPPSP
jgi:Calcineurin-like phosphoesterase